jgi:hypothetical protein
MLAIIVSIFASITPNAIFGIKPYLLIWDHESIKSYSQSKKWFHTTPNIYSTSFFIGIAFGILMRRKLFLSRMQEFFIWILSITLISIVYLWNNSFYRLDKSAPFSSVILWFSIGKLLFSIGFSWILFALCSGRGGEYWRFFFHGIFNLSKILYILIFFLYRIFKSIFIVEWIPTYSSSIIWHLFSSLFIYFSSNIHC